MKLKKVIIILVVIAFVASVAIYFSMAEGEKTEYTTAQAARGRLSQTVSETGTIKAASEVELNFSGTGRIAKIPVKVGDKVEKDQVLSELDHSGLLIKQKEAEANLAVARANLNKINAGATSEEIYVYEADASRAHSAYEAALRDMERTKSVVAENIVQTEKTLNDLEKDTSADPTTYEQAVKSSQTALDNAKSTYKQAIDNDKPNIITVAEAKLAVANNALDVIDRTVNDDDAEDTLSVLNMAYLTNTNIAYKDALALYDKAEKSLAVAKADQSEKNMSAAIDDAKNVFNKIFASLNLCFSALDNSVTTSAFTQSELDTLKSNINAQISLINTGVSSVESVEQDFDADILAYNTNVSNAEQNLAEAEAVLDNAKVSARNALNTANVSGEQQLSAAQSKIDSALESWNYAKAQLQKIKAVSRREDTDLALAQVNQAQASLDLIGNQIGDSIIKAPVGGIVTEVNYEAGEQSSLSKPVVSLLVENNFEAEVDVSEADIAKVAVGDSAVITLDAFGEDVKFGGKVRFIEPAETVIQDVIYYKVKIDFVEKDKLKNFKPGMTANVVITTDERDNILLVPSRAVVEDESGKFVRVLENGQPTEKKITTGARGDEGAVEVLSGLNGGEAVITYIKTEN